MGASFLVLDFKLFRISRAASIPIFREPFFGGG
jgi:hypothetical protein